MAKERARLDVKVAEETVRLMRLSHCATILAAQQEALFWAFKRERLVKESIAEGQDVSEQQNIDANKTCPLLTGALAADVNQDQGVRNVGMLTVIKIYTALLI